MADARLLVLVRLSDGPRHGYAIQTDIENYAGVHLRPGTLYGALTAEPAHNGIDVRGASARQWWLAGAVSGRGDSIAGRVSRTLQIGLRATAALVLTHAGGRSRRRDGNDR